MVPPDFETLDQWELIGWLMQNSHPAHQFSDPNTFFDDDGLFSKEALVSLCKAHAAADPVAIKRIAGRFDYTIEWTPPYWPQCQMVELFWSNMKWDFRTNWSASHRKSVPVFVKTFFHTVKPSDLVGWCEKTDKFCNAVLTKDAAELKPLELQLIS